MNHSSNRATYFVHFGFVASAVYLLSLLYNVFVTRGGASEIAELQLNALGDFLAGSFAPLAFMWLVIAVFVQKEELQAQLREVQDSNKQMRQQYDLQLENAERQIVDGKFAFLSSECIVLCDLFEFDDADVKKLHDSDSHPESIGKFVELLDAFVESCGGTDVWPFLPEQLARNSYHILHHLSLVADRLQKLREWNKRYDDDDIKAKMIDAKLQTLEVNVLNVQLHLASADDQLAAH